jgi:regulator of sigma D
MRAPMREGNMNILQWAVDASDGAINALVYAVIVLLFVWGFFRCIVPIARTRGTLKRAIRLIKKGASGKRSWQEDKFLGKGRLFPHWSEYLNNLFFADGVYHNASNVEDYINEDTVIYGPGRMSFAEAIPGLMVSLGFLGTLMGLTEGLTGFSMSDAEAVQHSIVTLIPGMRYAFMTSIWGVVGSISFTLITRFISGSTQHTLQDFYGAMSRYAGVLSVDPMTQIAIYQQEQTSLIQTIAQEIGGGFSEKFETALTGALAPIQESLENFMAVNTQQQMRLIDKVAGRFVERVDEMLEGELKNLSDVIDSTCRSQLAATAIVQEGMQNAEKVLKNAAQLEKNLEDMVGKLEGYMESLKHTQTRADDSYLRIASNVEKMELVAGQQNSYLKSVSAMHGELNRSMLSLQEAQKEMLQRFSEVSGESTAGLMKAAGELRATGAMLENNRQRIGEQLRLDLSDTLDSFRDYMAEFTKRVDYLSAGIADALNQLPDAVGGATDHFLDQIDRISQALERAEASLSAAAARLYRQ